MASCYPLKLEVLGGCNANRPWRPIIIASSPDLCFEPSPVARVPKIELEEGDEIFDLDDARAMSPRLSLKKSSVSAPKSERIDFMATLTVRTSG